VGSSFTILAKLHSKNKNGIKIDDSVSATTVVSNMIPQTDVP
jgi:hypothetical protein